MEIAQDLVKIKYTSFILYLFSFDKFGRIPRVISVLQIYRSISKSYNNFKCYFKLYIAFQNFKNVLYHFIA